MTCRVAQFFLKIDFLAQHMGTRGRHAYGLHPWLWLLETSNIFQHGFNNKMKVSPKLQESETELSTIRNRLRRGTRDFIDSWHDAPLPVTPPVECVTSRSGVMGKAGCMCVCVCVGGGGGGYSILNINTRCPLESVYLFMIFTSYTCVLFMLWTWWTLHSPPPPPPQMIEMMLKCSLHSFFLYKNV